MSRRSKKHLRRPTIADECEAFLAGQTWQLYSVAGHPVPAWAQLNRLAHGSFDDLVGLATDVFPGAPPKSDMTWEFVRNLLAQRIIADTGTPQRLRGFQTSILVPLEPGLFNEGAPLDVFPDEFFHFVLDHIIEAARHEQQTT